MKRPEHTLRPLLAKREKDHSLRTLPDKSHLVDFCSNDYLGLARSQSLQETIIHEIKNYNRSQLGSTGSRLISGNYSLYQEVEEMVAAYHKAEAGLIFNSGYDANLGFFSSVPQYNDLVIFDELIHASIRDGLKVSRGKSVSFKHNDLHDLEAQLKGDYENVFIAVESVHSMDGDFSPLEAIADLCEKYDAQLVVDEAHATGLFGEKGEGRIVELGLEDECFARVHTFGKALGCNGAIVVGSQTLKDFLINYSRPFIFSTALPFYNIMSIKCVYDILSNQQDKTLFIRNLSALFKNNLQLNNRAELISSQSMIQSLVMPGNNDVLRLSQALEDAGFYAKAILYPTVPRGKERIRFCFHSFNKEDEVIGLVKVINDYLK